MRWPGEWTLKSGYWTVFYSGGKGHQLGVGFIINDKILLRIKNFKVVNDRIYYIELKCRWYNVIFINGYVPTEKKEVNDIFFEELDNVCDSESFNKMKIIIGDINAKISQETLYRPTIGKDSLHRVSNDNGIKLILLWLETF